MADVSGDGEDFDVQLRAVAREATRPRANEWHSKATELLYERADEQEFDVQSIAQSALPPQWDDSEQAWVFTFPHTAAPFLEFGADEHEIAAKNAEFLAFEWPEGGDVVLDEETGTTVREAFEKTFPTVFFKKVNHPGVPALKYMRDSWKEVFSE
jgi:hypothetical protein